MKQEQKPLGPIGPEEFPTNSIHEGANANQGKPLGDKSSRTPPSTGQSLAMGLSERVTITETPDDLGMGRDVSTGKPDGPEMGKVNNGGASADLSWG